MRGNNFLTNFSSAAALDPLYNPKLASSSSSSSSSSRPSSVASFASSGNTTKDETSKAKPKKSALHKAYTHQAIHCAVNRPRI
ncbi:hypothetical protein HKX48_008512 [Thoreauomyces humboldtii]|nr:hypothetical protein HKX48_008512 [Thoreauomyces humboldtii]